MTGARPARPESSSDEELRQRLKDSEVQERLRQIHEQIESDGTPTPGISQDELQYFLRGQRKQLDL